MSLLEKIFGRKPALKAPEIKFGRYTDAYKTPEQKSALDQSIVLHESGRALEAYEAFLVSLRDPLVDNVYWERRGDTLHFEFRQGSALVSGTIDTERVRAECRMAQVLEFNVGFLRRLVEQNFDLRYCRYALTPDHFLALVFDSYMLDASPLKLQSALRELAIHADKQDDLLGYEFSTVRMAAVLGPDSVIPQQEKDIKYAYFQRTTQEVIRLLEDGRPDPNQYPGGYAFLLLGLAFRLDYLLRPEGYMMHTLEKMYAIYFSNNGHSQAHKVMDLKKELLQLAGRSKEDIQAEMYRTVSTFGVSPSVKHERIRNMIDTELPRMEWHLQHQHPAELTLAVPKYIVGHCLFYFAPPPPVRDLLHLFFQITESVFFAELGYPDQLADLHTGLPIQKHIEKSLKDLVNRHRKDYPQLKVNAGLLRYGALPLFAKSYLEMVHAVEGVG